MRGIPRRKRPAGPPLAIDPASGARLRAARLARGVTLRELADAMAIPGGYPRLCRVERGRVYASLDVLHRAAVALGVDPHEVDPRLASDRRG